MPYPDCSSDTLNHEVVTMNPFVERHYDRIAGVISCFDRIVITGTLPDIGHAQAMTGYLTQPGRAGTKRRLVEKSSSFCRRSREEGTGMSTLWPLLRSCSRFPGLRAMPPLSPSGRARRRPERVLVRPHPHFRHPPHAAACPSPSTADCCQGRSCVASVLPRQSSIHSRVLNLPSPRPDPFRLLSVVLTKPVLLDPSSTPCAFRPRRIRDG